jgi:hypothetical protein
VTGNPDSRDVSAVRVLAARESRREERTTSLSHLIPRDDMTVVFTSANRRLPEFADTATPLNDVAVGRRHHDRYSHGVGTRNSRRSQAGTGTIATRAESIARPADHGASAASRVAALRRRPRCARRLRRP